MTQKKAAYIPILFLGRDCGILAPELFLPSNIYKDGVIFLHRQTATPFSLANKRPEVILGRLVALKDLAHFSLGEKEAPFLNRRSGMPALLLMHAEQLNHTLLICQTYLHINKRDHSYKLQCCSPFRVV